MTIILTYFHDGAPIIIGDLLLSGPENSENAIEIPVIGDITRIFPAGSGFSIVGLCQKVNLIARNCVVAWAGNKLGATMVIKDLRNMASFRSLYFDDIANYFNTLDPDIVKLDVSFVGWINVENEFRRFSYNASKCDIPCLGNVSIAGTGKVIFSEIAEIMPAIALDSSREASSWESAITRALLSTGILLQGELITQRNLLHYFGGGYEIATFANNCFKKLDDITFVFWEAVVGESRIDLFTPMLVIKQKYIQDMLVIRSIRVTQDERDSEPIQIESSLHVVLPVYRNNEKVEIQSVISPDMNSQTTAHYIFVESRSPSHSQQVLMEIEYGNGKPSDCIRFTSVSDRILMSINKDFVNNLIKSIRQRVKNM